VASQHAIHQDLAQAHAQRDAGELRRGHGAPSGSA
jgi:hypothetical protein